MAERAPDQRDLLIALAEAQIDFVVIGGHAVSAHGYERATRDVDIVFSTDPDSCDRLADLLRRLDSAVRVADLPAPDGTITSDWLGEGGRFVFVTAYGVLDALSWIAGRDHATLESRALTAQLSDGTELRICGYDDLIAMKRTAGRPRDREDLRELESLREQRRGQ